MLLSPKASKYRVVKGDSLWRIAETQYGNPTVWPGIGRANHLRDPDLVLVGMWLTLPALPALPYHPQGKQRSHLPQPHLPPTGTAQLPQTSSPPHAGGSLSPTTLRVSQTASRVPGPATSHPTAGHWQFDSPQLQHYGSRIAVPVLFPAVKYKLDDFPPIVVSTPEMEFSLRFIGEVTLQQKGTMTEVEVGQGLSLSAKLEAEYKSKLADLAGSVKIGFNPQTRAVQVSCGFTVASKIDGHVFAISEYEWIPPNQLKYSYKPTPIQGDSQNVVFAGSVGFELVVTLNNPGDPTSGKPLPVASPQLSSAWAWAVAGALVVVGTAIIVGDILKDVGTAGLGTPESPLSFAAASELFSEAAALAP